jgi:hypothetical protein
MSLLSLHLKILFKNSCDNTQGIIIIIIKIIIKEKRGRSGCFSACGGSEHMCFRTAIRVLVTVTANHELQTRAKCKSDFT